MKIALYVTTRSAMDETELLDTLVNFVVLKEATKMKKRKIWSKDWLLKRNYFSHVNLLEEIRAYPEDFNNFMRMDEESYLHLLSLVSPLIEKQSTVMRSPITPHERLTVTLRYLATGRSYQDLKCSACVSQPALSQIIPETCAAIHQVLVKDYLKVTQFFLLLIFFFNESNLYYSV